MDFRAGTGSLSCRLCGASYQMPIHHLHEPIDVFSEWLDDCEAAAQGKPTGNADDPVPRYEDESDVDEPAPSPPSKPPASRDNSNKRDERPSFTALGLEDSDDSDDE